MRRFGLRTKLFLAFGIVLLPVFVLLIINFRTNQGWRESLVLEGQRLTAEAVAVQVDGAFDAAIGFGWAVANDPLIQSLDSNRLDPHLKQLMERHPFYQEISVFDAQGVNRGYGHLSLPAEPRANVKSARYFQSVMATNFPMISEVMELARPAGAIGVVAATPIRKGNQVIGVVAIVMTAEQLAKRYEETRLLPGQAIVLVDPSAHLAFHSLRRNLSYQASGAFKDLQPLRIALAGIPANAGQFVDPVTNAPCLGMFVPTLRHHWAVGVTMPPSIALAPVYNLLRQQLWTFTGLLLLSALLAYFLARYLVVPFFRLSEAALALGRGDLTRRVDIRTGDEIGLLGDSFNMMAAKIEERDIALREREARIRRLVESNIIGILFWKLTGEATEANDAFLRMVGYTREDLAAGRVRWMDMTPQEYRSIDQKAIDDLLKTGSCPPFDKEYIRKDGSRAPVMIGCAFFEGSQDSGVAFILDLTERNRAEMELKRHRDHLEERTEQLLVAKERAEFANRAKTEFLAKMSHELRTPLNSVLGYAQILKRGRGLTADQVRGLNAIDENGWQLLSLINDLLNVSQIEAGQIELHYKMVDLVVFMREIVDAIQIKAQEKGLSFIYEPSSNVPRAVEVDEKRLRQIFLNLLENGVKFTERGQVTLRVQCLRADDRQARVRVEIQDSGIGIAAEQLDAIFRPFEQAGDLKYRYGGSGLGLTISRELVRLMGGEIQVESKVGEGSLFWFELDIRKIHTRTSALHSDDSISYRGDGIKVLVVDDIPANRALMVDALRGRGFDMIEARNGREGLEKAQSFLPDLILMDIVMPEMDGLELTRRLRRLAAFKNVVIIIVSASATREDEAESLAVGANIFLSKPVAIDLLLKEIGRLLKLARDSGESALPEAKR